MVKEALNYPGSWDPLAHPRFRGRATARLVARFAFHEYGSFRKLEVGVL